jgi:hypothetical protein
MHRHAAHRNVLAFMLAAFRELDIERGGGAAGIGKEQLVEIAHAVEQQAIGMRALELEILRHRRGRRFGGVRGCGGHRFAGGFADRFGHAGKLAENAACL